jgi:multiple sugar transport system permease protein
MMDVPPTRPGKSQQHQEPSKAASRKNLTRRIRLVALYLALSGITLIWIFPVAWVFITSIKPDQVITIMPPSWDFRPTLVHYVDLFRVGSFPLYFYNSAMVALSATLISMACGLPAAYSIVRFGVGGEKFRLAILGSRMIPPVVLVLPMFVLFQSLGLNHTLVGLILGHSAMLAPFNTWLMIGFLQGIPSEIEEAALIDGCSHLGVLTRVTLPLARPGLATSAVMSLIISWNDLFYAILDTCLGSSRALLASCAEATRKRPHPGRR